MEKRERPEPWKKRRAGHRWYARPFIAFEWACEWAVYSLRQWAFIELLELLGKLAIAVSVVTYRDVEETQRKQKAYQAWQVINSAFGKPGDGGRRDALRDLTVDGVWLDSIDLAGATLRGVNLGGARLYAANLRGAVLNFADLSDTLLAFADLRGTFLDRANLTGADLSFAELNGAFLGNANLTRATLIGVKHLEQGATESCMRLRAR